MSVTPVSCAIICWVRRARRAASWLGSAQASSIELVCRDWVPLSTAASAWMATLTTLFSGCSAVSVAPAVWAWVRSHQERSFFAPKRSRISRAHILRAARNLAISSKKSWCTLKKKLSRGAKSSTSRPRSWQARTYSNPSARVNANSWTAVEPASRMW